MERTSDDVELVQRLIAIAFRDLAPPQELILPTPTGKFDPVTGFYVFSTQRHLREAFPNEVIDGIVSPARDGHQGYGAGSLWTIVALNLQARHVSQSDWEALLRRFPSRGVLRPGNVMPFTLRVPLISSP